MALSFYKYLYIDDSTSGSFTSLVNLFPTLSLENKELLDSPFIADDVKSAFFCHGSI